jgi:hypothetical protein
MESAQENITAAADGESLEGDESMAEGSDFR